MRCGRTCVTSDDGRSGRQLFSSATFSGGGAFQPGAQLDQTAKWIFGIERSRSQAVTLVEAPRYMAFAGPMGSSAARWGMELEPIDDGHTDTMMWIEVDLTGIMRAIPSSMLKRRIQRVSDLEMVLIKSAVESSMCRRSSLVKPA